MIFLKNLKFSPSFSFVKTNLENVFANDLQKYRLLKNRIFGIFPKGLTHD